MCSLTAGLLFGEMLSGSDCLQLEGGGEAHWELSLSSEGHRTKTDYKICPRSRI